MLGANVNSFWNCIKSKRKNKNVSLLTMKYQNKPLHGNSKVCNGFVKYFKSVYDTTTKSTFSNNSIHSIEHNTTNNSYIFINKFTVNEVRD